jgi:hypothetical protein
MLAPGIASVSLLFRHFFQHLLCVTSHAPSGKIVINKVHMVLALHDAQLTFLNHGKQIENSNPKGVRRTQDGEAWMSICGKPHPNSPLDK